MPDVWQASNWSTNFEVTCMTQPRKIPTAKAGIKPRSPALEVEALTTRPTKQFGEYKYLSMQQSLTNLNA